MPTLAGVRAPFAEVLLLAGNPGECAGVVVGADAGVGEAAGGGGGDVGVDFVDAGALAGGREPREDRYHLGARLTVYVDVGLFVRDRHLPRRRVGLNRTCRQYEGGSDLNEAELRAHTLRLLAAHNAFHARSAGLIAHRD